MLKLNSFLFRRSTLLLVKGKILRNLCQPSSELGGWNIGGSGFPDLHYNPLSDGFFRLIAAQHLLDFPFHSSIMTPKEFLEGPLVVLRDQLHESFIVDVLF